MNVIKLAIGSGMLRSAAVLTHNPSVKKLIPTKRAAEFSPLSVSLSGRH